MANCTYCGKTLSPNATRCTNCGETKIKLTREESESANFEWRLVRYTGFGVFCGVFVIWTQTDFGFWVSIILGLVMVYGTWASFILLGKLLKNLWNRLFG